jgi:hypothetical protein
MCSGAYEAAGLLWAARANMIAAASLALTEFWKEGRVSVQAFACLQRLFWVEIQLGRVPIALSWITTASVIATTLIADGELRKKFLEERQSQDFAMGILLLKTKFSDLKHLAFLPEISKNLDLPSSYMASLYAIGYEDTLQTDGWIPQENNELDIYEFFRDWITHPESQYLPEAAEFLVSPEIEMVSHVLGCNIVARVPNNNNSLFVAESIFAALEGFLATSLDSRIYPHQSYLQLNLVASQDISKPLDFQVKDTDGKPLIEIQHSAEDLNISDFDRKVPFRDSLAELITQIIIQIAFVPNPEEFFRDLIKDELGLARALNFTDIATGVKNILGDNPKLRISEWALDEKAEALVVRRFKSWHSEVAQTVVKEKSDVISPIAGKGVPNAELINIDSLKHGDRKILSFINVNLWNQAAWSATGFGFIAELHLPILILLFQDEAASKKIFSQWREEIGPEDVDEKLRISILTGISAKNPSAYRIAIGINPDWSRDTNNNSKGSTFIAMSRIHTMEPADSRNLDQFLMAFNSMKSYILAPGCVSSNNSIVGTFTELGILKRQIFVRPAWQVDEHDLDICGLHPDDDIIIPNGIEEPPVARALAYLKEMERKQSSPDKP